MKQGLINVIGINIIHCKREVREMKRLGDLMASVLVSGSSSLGSSPGRTLCCVLGQDT